MSLKKYLPNKELRNSKEFSHTLILFGSQILFIGIGFLNKSIQTNEFGPEVYGHFAFVSSFLMFSSAFFPLGFSASAQVLLAESSNQKVQKEITGAGIIYFLITGVIYSGFILLSSYFIDSVYGLGLGSIFRSLSILAPLFLFRFFVNAIAIGTGKVLGISIYEISGRVIFLCSMLVLIYHKSFTLESVVFFNLLSMGMGAIIIGSIYSPSFQNLRPTMSRLWDKNRKHGFPLFLGGALQQSTYRLDEMMIPYFVGSTELGFYTLAGALCSPIPMLSQAASRSLFRKMASGDKINNTFFRLNTAWLLLSSLGLVLVVHWIVPILFGPGFEEVAWITNFLVIAFMIQGLLQPFSYLNAKSQGVKVRNAHAIGSVVNVIGNFSLIPFFGVIGAVIASIISRATNLGLFYHYYKVYQKERES